MECGFLVFYFCLLEYSHLKSLVIHLFRPMVLVRMNEQKERRPHKQPLFLASHPTMTTETFLHHLTLIVEIVFQYLLRPPKKSLRKFL